MSLSLMKIPICLFCISCLFLLPGCTAEMPTGGERMVYPVSIDTPPGEIEYIDADIKIERDGFWYVYVTNQSPREWNNVTLWLNETYGRRIDSLKIGERRYFDLESFYDAYGQSYPTGDPISPKDSRSIKKANLQDEKQLYRLNIIHEKNWRDEY